MRWTRAARRLGLRCGGAHPQGGYAPVGQFGWDGGSGTSTYADPVNGLTGIPLTQVGMSAPNSAHLIHDFWTSLYQALDN